MGYFSGYSLIAILWQEFRHRKGHKTMKSVICFGTGAQGRGFIAMTEGKINIEYFLDNSNTGKIGKYDILIPSKENCTGKYIIVTTSTHYGDIKRQLESYGLHEHDNFISIIEFLMKNDELLTRKINEGANWQHFLRKRKAAYYQLYNVGDFLDIKDLVHETYKNAIILPLKRFSKDGLLFGRGGVVDQSGNYVKMSGIEERIEGKYSYGSPKYRNKRVVYCGYMVWQWGHFLVEAVARLWYFLKSDESIDNYVFFVDNGAKQTYLKGNYKEFFRLLGILDKIELINEPIQYREIVVPQLAYGRTKYYSQQFKDIFSAVADNALQECRDLHCYNKIYLSRSRWNKAEFGLDMLDDFFGRNGFDIIYPETVTLAQLIFIIQKADIIASVSGSTAHNILFGKDRQELVLMERCALNNEIQADINKMKKINVYHIDANMSFFPVSYGEGPFLFCWNGFLERFAAEKGWELPSKKFKEEAYVKKNIKRYLEYYDRYDYDDFVDPVRYELYKEAKVESIQDIKNNSFDLSHMIKNTKVSIIIPVQNSEKYLKECIQSALSQTFKDIEVLCIDGGSTDSSSEIIRQIQKEDDRVIYINDSNTSYGHKLNIGIGRARGEYFAILESDDRMCSDMVERLYSIAQEQDIDIADADHYELFCYKDKEYQHVRRKYPNIEYYNHLIYHDGNIHSRFITTFGIWTALYRKKFIVEQNIRFNESEGASYQDTSFMFLTSILSGKQYHLNIPLYQYRVDNAESSVKSNKKIYEIVGECEFLKNDLERRGIQEKELWDLYYIRKYNAFYWNYCRLSLEASALFLEKYLDELKKDIEKGFVKRELFTNYLYDRTFLLLDNKSKFVDMISKLDKDTWAIRFCALLDKLEGKDVIIFGAGILGTELIDILQQNENKIRGICDNSVHLQGIERNGFTISPVEKIVAQFFDAVYLITSWKYAKQMKTQLMSEGIKESNIIIFR